MAADRREARCAGLVALLEDRALDGLVVSHLPNIRYLTGFSGTAAILAVTRRGDPVVVTDFRYATQVEAEVGALARVEIVSTDPLGHLLGVLKDRVAGGSIGFEGHVVTAKQAETLAAADGLTMSATDGLVEGLRAAKDPDEIEAIRQAGSLALEALAAVLPAVKTGRREIDVAADLEAELRRRGSEWHPFPTIVASGPRAALPHAGTSTREIGKGEFVLLDFGAQVDGYCADVTRTVVVGAKADERQRTVYEIVRQAQETARTNVRAGMTGKDADRLARSVIEERGFGDAFGHSLGHGLGLEVHEEPRLSATNEQALPEGAAVTIEPSIYLPGWGGVRLEDDVVLSMDGPSLLTDGKTELKELI
jgi:Xaa-Pro aminopeptidase